MFKKGFGIVNLIWIVTIILLLSFAFNITPYLRGPAPYPPEWQWPYQFTNTLNKLWFPAIVIIGIIFFGYKVEKAGARIKQKNEQKIIGLLILLGFLFQISVLFYSRSGISVVVHRVVNPGISGYFSTSLTITNISDFLRYFNENIATYPLWAAYHPPGAVLFFRIITIFVTPFSYFFSFLNQFVPTHHDFAQLWMKLDLNQKTSSVFSGFLIPFLANITIVPLYFAAKMLYGIKTAMRSIFIYVFIPSIVLFTPHNDVFIPFFGVISFLFLVRGIKRLKSTEFILSGIFLFLGVFFSLTFLPMLLLFSLFILLSIIKSPSPTKLPYLKNYSNFVFGLLIIPLLLFLFFNLNSLQTLEVITKLHVATEVGRSYRTWLFYNLYDFFIFSGFPIAMLFFYKLYLSIKRVIQKRFMSLKTIDPLYISFIVMLSAVQITGVVRGEAARIMTPYLPILVLIIANFLSDKIKVGSWNFISLLLLQAIQIIVFQTVLVTVW